jgi:hypothetical protein
MSTRETQPEAGESFPQRLQRLRLKIDSLPPTQRPHLVDLAEAIARQYRQLHHRTSANDDAGEGKKRPASFSHEGT